MVCSVWHIHYSLLEGTTFTRQEKLDAYKGLKFFPGSRSQGTSVIVIRLFRRRI